MRKRSTGGSLVDISIARNSISDEDYFVASKSLKCRMRNVIKGFKNDKRDAKRKFWHSSRKGSKDQVNKRIRLTKYSNKKCFSKEMWIYFQDSSNSDDESEFSETRSFEADILREILDALPTVRAPLGEGRGSFDRSDSGFEERDAASDILSGKINLGFIQGVALVSKLKYPDSYPGIEKRDRLQIVFCKLLSPPTQTMGGGEVRGFQRSNIF